MVGLLFVIQTMAGAASEHYRADLTSFFGFDLGRWLPYNLVRTWHVQLSIFWTATSFLAAGLFLAPIVSGREPRRQSWLGYGPLGALALVDFGSMIGEALDIHGWLSPSLHLIGMQGWEYLDLGRLWQVLLTAGLFLRASMLFRGLRAALRRDSRLNLPWLFFYTGLAIPAFYAVGLLTSSESSYTVADFWRFMVVHLWVEDFLEIFTTVLVAYLFVLLGVVRQKVALDHHLPRHHPGLHWWRGRHDAPPVLLRHSGRDHGVGRVLLRRRGVAADVPHRRGLVVPAARLPPAAVLRNAVPAPVGADVPDRRRVLELPRGWGVRVPGQPAGGVLLRDRHRPDRQPRPRRDDGRLRHARDRAGAVLRALPDPRAALAGQTRQDLVLVVQHRAGLDVLRDAASARCRSAVQVGQDGYFAARQLELVTNPSNQLLEWMHLPGDVVFIAGGALPFLWICWLGLHYRTRNQVMGEPHDVLFTEIGEPAPLPPRTRCDEHPR